MKEQLTVYFVCESFSGYKDFFCRKTDKPQGLAVLYRTWNGYTQHGHRVHIFTQDHDYDDYCDWNGNGWNLHNVPAPIRYLRQHRFTRLGKVLARVSRLVGLYRVWKKISRVAQSDPPDVVYSYSAWSTIPAGMVARRYKALNIYRRFGTFLYEVMTGKKSLWSDDSHLIEALSHKFTYDLMIMTNDGTFGDRTSLHYGCPPEKLRFWTNGINKDMYDPHFDRRQFRINHGLSEDAKIVLSLGRLADWKRVDRVFHMMKEVKRRDPSIRLLVVGSGAKEGELKVLARELDIEDVTLFVGPVAHEQVKNYFNGSDVYVQFFDTTNRCNPLFEAMICKLPVVALKDPSTEDMVIHGKTALTIEPDDHKKAAEYVLQLLHDDEKKRELGQNAHDYIMTNFQSWDERIEMEIDTVKQLYRDKMSICSSER